MMCYVIQGWGYWNEPTGEEHSMILSYLRLTPAWHLSKVWHLSKEGMFDKIFLLLCTGHGVANASSLKQSPPTHATKPPLISKIVYK